MAYRLLARFDDQTIRSTLRPGKNIIGSDPSCDVSLPNATVSRRHGAITIGPQDKVELEDLGSTNGTLLRSRRIDRVSLEAGDIFVVGRVVLLLEKISDDDIEIGVDFRRETVMPEPGPVAVARELTESFSPLDHFSLERLPRLLELLCRGIDRQNLAQEIGFALFETLPVTNVEIVESGDGGKGVLYATEGTEDHGDTSRWVDSTAGSCQVRAYFFKQSGVAYYRPVIESAVRLLALAEREAAAREVILLPPVGNIERPQPASVDEDVQRIYDQAERVARGDVGVLIVGESGTGKEVLAKFIHSASPRASQAFVPINCASLPRDLLEAELFGVERGVATGVEERAGKFELADQGTIFLDEIGDMAQETQAKILRVLQEREVFRLGGKTPHPARARVIAATNRPIHKMLAEGTFRADLYHRIATWEVELPPLRRRRTDIANLAAHFLTREARRYGIRVRGISRAALRLMGRYRWPGNIRQLRNEIARAILFLEDGELLDTARLSVSVRGEPQVQLENSLAEVLEGVERDEISAALEACGGDTALAAKRLKISRPTLYRRIRSLDIQIPGQSEKVKSSSTYP